MRRSRNQFVILAIVFALAGVASPLMLVASATAADGSFDRTWARTDKPVDDNSYASSGVTAAKYVPETDHSVASPFWTFMTDEATVWDDGQNVTAPLFSNPFYATGYPITEAYWSEIVVGGIQRDVLW